LDGFQIGVLGLAAGNGKGRDVDVRVEDGSHGQRF
jgi:hypothetical protein